MRKEIFIALICLLFSLPLPAQSAGDDYTGLYSFLKDGESIQLNVQNGNLSGWVSSYGFHESDREILSDNMFSKATLNGNQIYFVTKKLHGCWLEFSGRIARGNVRSRAKEGYYQLSGKLTEYISDEDGAVSAREREVTFKSQPQPDAGDVAQ